MERRLSHVASMNITIDVRAILSVHEVETYRNETESCRLDKE